jgi:hypothetical protein
MADMRILILYVLWFFAFNAAFVYGDIWDSQAHPYKDVGVALNNNEVINGTLYRQWDKTWVLTTESGNKIRAKEFVMSGKLSSSTPEESRTLLLRWRFWLPIVFVLGFFGFFAINDLLKSFGNLKNKNG